MRACQDSNSGLRGTPTQASTARLVTSNNAVISNFIKYRIKHTRHMSNSLNGGFSVGEITDEIVRKAVIIVVEIIRNSPQGEKPGTISIAIGFF